MEKKVRKERKKKEKLKKALNAFRTVKQKKKKKTKNKKNLDNKKKPINAPTTISINGNSLIEEQEKVISEPSTSTIVHIDSTYGTPEGKNMCSITTTKTPTLPKKTNKKNEPKKRKYKYIQNKRKRTKSRNDDRRQIIDLMEKISLQTGLKAMFILSSEVGKIDICCESSMEPLIEKHREEFINYFK